MCRVELYINRDGIPISSKLWMSLIEDPDYRLVDRYLYKEFMVSTIWLGSQSHTFETAVGTIDDDGYYHVIRIFDSTTEQEARATHSKAIKLVHKSELPRDTDAISSALYEIHHGLGVRIE